MRACPRRGVGPHYSCGVSHYLDRALMNERLGDGPWHDVDVAPSIGSTNDELEANPRAWRALVTDNQTAGRGRLDRAWVAEPGQSIAMSATLPLPTDATRWGWVPLLVGVGPNNHQYLATKRDRMGHIIAEQDLSDALEQMREGAGA